MLKITDGKIGYGYQISDVEIKYGYITVASKRIDITQGTISPASARLILERQLRNIGNVLEQFVREPLSQTQFDALLHYFYYIGVDKIETSSVIELINMKRWYDITDEMQTNIKRNSGKIVNSEKMPLRKKPVNIFCKYFIVMSHICSLKNCSTYRTKYNRISLFNLFGVYHRIDNTRDIGIIAAVISFP